MTAARPILVANLFRELDQYLVGMLRSLSLDDWQRPTLCSASCVKDIAAHLLDTAFRRLSHQRDGYSPSEPSSAIHSPADLVAYVHRLNAEWTTATRRLSPKVLIELTEFATWKLADLFESVDPYAPAIYPVSWAGENESTMWFDVAREFTERWHHQRQIAEALGQPTPIDDRRFQHPVLDTFMLALPHTYRNVQAAPGTTILVRIDGPSGGDWFLERNDLRWEVRNEAGNRASAAVTVNQAIAWKFFTKRTTRETARQLFPEIELAGDIDLAEPVLEMVSIIA